MFALTDFTRENGATRVVPGSHKWAPDRQTRPEEITCAAMPAGSALIYLGSAIHGGGANTTTKESRRGMFLGYVVGWLRTEGKYFSDRAIKQNPRHAHPGTGAFRVQSSR